LEVMFWGLIPQTDTASFYMRFSQSSTFLSGASDYLAGYSGTGDLTDAADSEIELLSTLGTSTNEQATVCVRIIKPLAASNQTSALWIGGLLTATPGVLAVHGYGRLIANANPIDGVRFLMSTGNIASGNYSVMARRYS
jgi:hypothetical protein